MVITWDSDSRIPGSIPGGGFVLYFFVVFHIYIYYGYGFLLIIIIIFMIFECPVRVGLETTSNLGAREPESRVINHYTMMTAKLGETVKPYGPPAATSGQQRGRQGRPTTRRWRKVISIHSRASFHVPRQEMWNGTTRRRGKR